jgi:hypothetical protein
VQVFCTAESKSQISIVTTASQSISFNYPKDAGQWNPDDSEDDEWATAVIAETYLTKLKDGKIVSEAQEGIE